MKIAMVSEHANPLAAIGGVDSGGQNLHVAELSKALARAGHEVCVYTRRDDPKVAATVPLCAGVRVEHVPAGPAAVLPKDSLLGLMPAFAAELAARWRQDWPDVVHAHFWMSGLASREAAGGQIPVLQTFHALGSVKARHQGERDTSPAGRIEAERDLACAADAVIATCTDEVFELSRLGVLRTDVAVVPCGVDLDHFRPRTSIRRRPGLLRILSVGRLVERKGFGLLIEALPRVLNAELVIAGGPPPGPELDADPEARRLLALAARHGVAHRVRLLGAVTRADMPALLRSADVVACTPWYEPFGIVPVEAMACGMPVVATAVGGFVDTVVDGVTGLLVASHSVPELAAALRRLLGDAALRAGFGAAAVARARAGYGWAGIAAQTEGIYHEVTARSRVTAGIGVL